MSWCQVERGKQAHYCYDDADLKEIVNTFPANASYHIQRFKGTHQYTFYSLLCHPDEIDHFETS